MKGNSKKGEAKGLTFYNFLQTVMYMNNIDTDIVNQKLDEVQKPYVQFSKKIVGFLFVDLIFVELFVMYMIFITQDTSALPYFITGICVTVLSGIIWYLKNSEAEKKARISAEVERMKFLGIIPTAFDKVLSSTSGEPDTYYKENNYYEDNYENNYIEPNDSEITGDYTFDDGSVG